MPALAILNPRKRKAAGGKTRRRKMTAKQLKFFGPRKAKKIKRRRAAGAKPKSKVIIVQSNPKGSVMAAKKKTRTRRRKAAVFTHKGGKRRRFRRNPRSIEAGFVNNTLLPAAIGAAGAIGADMLLSYAPIPVQYKTGGFGIVLKIASALLVGAAVGSVSNRAAGEEAAAGGVIVTLYGLSKGFLANAGAPGMSRYVPMQRYVPMNGYAPQMLNRGQGAWAPGRPGSSLGYMNPGRIAAPPAQLSRANMRYMASR